MKTSQTIIPGTLRVNLIRPGDTFDTLSVPTPLPDDADMTDICLHEILDLLKVDKGAGNIIKEVDVEDYRNGKWQKLRMILTFKDHLAA